MKKIAKISKFLLVLVLIINWIFSGFPQIFNFPPEIQQAQAATKTIILNYTQTILTEGTTWTVPADWTSANNTIEVIGGGGAGFTDTTGIAGAGGGGGGGYSKITNLTLIQGATVTYQIGVGGKNNAATGGAPNGGATFFNRTAGSAGTCADTVSVCANAGLGATSPTGAAGGSTTGAKPTSGGTLWAGGAGGLGNTTGDAAGGGGGAGGPSANGRIGGAGYAVTTGGGGGGGGGNGGSSSAVGAVGTTIGGAGGAGDLGIGGGTGGSAANGGNGTASGAGGGGSDSGKDAGNGANGTTTGGGVGPGGGGGGSGDTTTAIGNGGDGGLYGAGGGGGRYGGRGAPGVIIITYNGNTPTRTTWTVPTDWNSSNNTIEVIGGGGSSFSAVQGTGSSGGGGGAYSKATNVTLTRGGTVNYAIGAGGRKTIVGVGAGVNGGDSYFCNATGANCTIITGSAVVAGAKGGTAGVSAIVGGAGGVAGNGYPVAGTRWSGGAGGAGHSTGDSGGGGGGAAGSSQNGLNGGIGYTAASGGGGGGGGAGDDSGANSTVGGAGISTNGGAGGNGPLGTGSGTAGANTFGGDATAGLGGGGGGGDTPFAGGEGGSGSATTYGGGGGGGVGDNNSVATGALFGGDGGLYGAGGGGGLMPGFGANGIIVITYTPNTPPTASISEPSGDDTIAQNGSFTITYALNDADDTVTAALYYDNDTSGYNGTAISACSAVPEAGTTCVWDTNTVPAGNYYIYASTTDSVNAPVHSAYSGALTINALPTASISQPDGIGDSVVVGASYDIIYTLADSDNTVTAALFWDTDGSGYDGAAIANCSAVVMGTDKTCAWNTTGRDAGSYYIYASTTDSVNAPVHSAYSGALTISVVNISVSITSDGFINYGYVPLSGTKSTIELPDTQNATNSGNVTEKFNIKTSNATSSASTWTLGSATGTQNVYIHSFATSSGWVKFASTDTYQRLVEGITQNSSQDFDLRIGAPSSVSDYEQKTISITIQAVQ